MELGEALDAVFSEHLRPVPPLGTLSPAERAAALPLDVRRGLAREIARTEGVQMRSAMRRLQRYVSGAGQVRRPSLPILARLARELAVRRFRRRGIRVRIAGVFRVSKDCRSRTIGFTIPAEDATPVLDAWVREDFDTMETAFEAAFARNYLDTIEVGCPDVPDDEAVEYLEIEGEVVPA